MIVPDGIEPLEALRAWVMLDDELRSLNGITWVPGEPMVARCIGGLTGTVYVWEAARCGVSRESACEITNRHNGQMFLSHRMIIPYPPSTVLPRGYGWRLVLRPTHEAPAEDCTCGVYAATRPDQLPVSGQVYGKVKLWGKIIPGEYGARAQYAYPSEFHVLSKDMLENETLKSFGVPIMLTDHPRGKGYVATLRPVPMSIALFSNGWGNAGPATRTYWFGSWLSFSALLVAGANLGYVIAHYFF